jgi:demethylmenaquinone methyltransferase/2-methoxy-6-polyprenyl-1,4-benzoquinol methylase
VPDEANATNEQARRVRDMFATIAARYDLLNHVLSGNIDRKWRRRVAETLAARLPRRARILDVACGTGDLSLTLFETIEAIVIGIDFCRPMLEIAACKTSKQASNVSLVEGDALRLPFADCSFDAVTIAFGLRNLTSLEIGLKEFRRVVKPGGNVAVLEFSKPGSAAFRWLFQFYFKNLLPVFGGLISGSRSAYQYLPDSVSKFPDQEHLASTMRDLGFADVQFQNLSGGIAALHLGSRPELI